MHTYTTGKIPPELQPAIRLLTNWQRNQWARAGYPHDLQIVSVQRVQDGLDLSYVASAKARLPRSRNIPPAPAPQQPEAKP